MKILDRYIAVAIATGTGIALLVILGLEIFFQILGQLDVIGVGSYTLWKMLLFVALGIPQSLYELFPMAALLGSLVGMGTLAAGSELIAMRASGVSVWRIVRSVLQAGMLMLVVVIAIGELLAPQAEHYGQTLRASAINRGVSFLGTLGLWVRDGNYYINVKTILTEEKLADVTIYEFDSDNRLAEIMTAVKANYSNDAWQLLDVERTQFPGDRVEVHRVDRLERQDLVTPELLSVVVLKPQAMSVIDIIRLIESLEENGLDAQQYRYAFWARLMTPVSSLVMLLVSVPFVFGSLRSVSSGQRIFTGILVGFAFYIVTQISSQMGQVYALNPLLSSFVPGFVFVLFGIRAIRRI